MLNGNRIEVLIASAHPLVAAGLEVLRLLVRRLPHKAIASRLPVGVGTAKSHMKSIRVKVNAASRTVAVEKARHCGLISEEIFARPAEHAVLRDARGLFPLR